jgi:hypothetical protein
MHFHWSFGNATKVNFLMHNLLKFLAVPASSAAVERMFSLANVQLHKDFPTIFVQAITYAELNNLLENKE